MTRTMRRLATTSSVVLLTAGIPLPGRSAETLLRWKLREGEVLEHRLSTTTAGSMVHLGREMRTEQSIQVDGLWKVSGVSGDGRARVAQSVERIQAKILLPDEPLQSYDSREGKRLKGPAAGMMNKIFDAFREGAATFVLSADGKPEEIKFSEGLLRAVRGTGPLGQSGGFFSEESLRQLIGTLPELPDRPVAQGQSWASKHELKLPFGRLGVASTHTYEGKETREGRELERIGIRNVMSFTKGDGELPIRIEFKSMDSSGRALFDAEAGRFVEQTIDQRVVLAIVTGDGPPAESTTTTRTVLELAERPPEPEARP